MSYRDDEEARLARLVALDRENEELREQLAEERRKVEELSAAREEPVVEPPAPAPPPPAPEPPAPAPRPRRRIPWQGPAAAVAMILALGGLGLATSDCGEAEPPVVERVEWVDGVLSIETRRGHGFDARREVYSVDPATGRRSGPMRVPGVAPIRYPRVGSRVWLVGSDEVVLVDLKAPGRIATAETVAARIPELAQGYRLGDLGEGTVFQSDGSISDERTWYPPAIPLVLDDGTTAWLDTTPALRRDMPRDGIEPRVGYACFHYDAPSCDQHRCYTWLDAPGTTTRALGWRREWGDDAAPVSDAAAPLHGPVFVKRLDRPCAVEIEGGLLVTHLESALDPPRRLLSLLDARGAIRWTIPLARFGRADAMPAGAVVDSRAIHVVLVDPFGEGVDRRDLDARRLDIVHLSHAGDVLGTRRIF